MQDRPTNNTNAIKNALRDYLATNNLDGRLIDAFEMGYVTENTLSIFSDWLQHHYPALRSNASTADLTWGDEFHRQVRFFSNRSDLYVHQDLILSKLFHILKDTGNTNDELLESLAKGHCAGFSVLVSYALETEGLPKTMSAEPLIDWTSIQKTFNLISNYSGQTLTHAQQTDINELLALIRKFQYMHLTEPSSQANLAEMQGNEFAKLFTIGAKFTEAEVQSLLDKIDALNPDHNFQILIASHDHEISINRINGQYIFYDSNNMVGPLPVAKQALASLISISNNFSPTKPSPLGFAVFSKHHDLHFLDAKEFLANTQEVRNKGWEKTDFNYALQHNLYSGLHMAALIGSTESISALITAGMRLDQPAISGQTALDLAIIHHHANIVSDLLTQGARLNPALVSSHLFHLARTQDINTLRALISIRSDEIQLPLFNLFDKAIRANDSVIANLALSGLTLTQTELKDFALMATQLNNATTLASLLTKGADPAAIYAPRGENLLHYAVKNERLELVKTILEHFPSDKLNVKRNDGLTVFDLTHHAEIRKLLIQAQSASANASARLFSHPEPTTSSNPTTAPKPGKKI